MGPAQIGVWAKNFKSVEGMSKGIYHVVIPSKDLYTMLEPLIHVCAKFDKIGREHIKDYIPI